MSRTLAIGVLTAAFALGAAAAARGQNDACWQLVFGAIKHSAASPHARFISYSETEKITADDNRLQRSTANITYRDDGIAYIDDDRWSYPFVSSVLDPGPPVLGPYGGLRPSWLELDRHDDFPLPVIADTHTTPKERCVDRGDDWIGGARYAHIVFPDRRPDRPALEEAWIDRSSYYIPRVKIAAWLYFYMNDPNLVHRLTDYTLEMQQVGAYTVLRQVNWMYTMHVYDQSTVLRGEFDFGNYRFESQAPPGTLFANEATPY